MNSHGRAPNSRATGRIAFAGVGFEFAAPAAVLQWLPTLEGVVCGAAAISDRLDRVGVGVRWVGEWPPATRAMDRAIRWRWSGAQCAIEAPHATIALRRTEDGYRAEARLAVGPLPLSAALAAIASAVIQDRGGVILHCASVLWRSAVVGFVGPSGAGKTTACLHVADASLYSIDRLAVVPDRLGAYWAAALPGGTVPEAPVARAASTRSWKPLRNLYFLGADRTRTQVQAVSDLRKVAALRASTLDGQQGAAAAGAMLKSLVRLVGVVPVAGLQLRLGDELAPFLAATSLRAGGGDNGPKAADRAIGARGTRAPWAK